MNMADYNILAANFGSLPAPPAGPGQIVVTADSSSTLRPNWIDNVSGETGWRVQDSDDGQEFSFLANVPGQRRDHVDRSCRRAGDGGCASARITSTVKASRTGAPPTRRRKPPPRCSPRRRTSAVSYAGLGS